MWSDTRSFSWVRRLHCSSRGLTGHLCRRSYQRSARSSTHRKTEWRRTSTLKRTTAQIQNNNTVGWVWGADGHKPGLKCQLVTPPNSCKMSCGSFRLQKAGICQFIVHRIGNQRSSFQKFGFSTHYNSKWIETQYLDLTDDVFQQVHEQCGYEHWLSPKDALAGLDTAASTIARGSRNVVTRLSSNNSKRFAVLIRTQLPSRFGNGLHEHHRQRTRVHVSDLLPLLCLSGALVHHSRQVVPVDDGAEVLQQFGERAIFASFVQVTAHLLVSPAWIQTVKIIDGMCTTRTHIWNVFFFAFAQQSTDPKYSRSKSLPLPPIQRRFLSESQAKLYPNTQHWMGRRGVFKNFPTILTRMIDWLSINFVGNPAWHSTRT